MIGIDGVLRDDIALGAFGGYRFADVHRAGAGNTRLVVSAFQVGIYES